MRIALWILLAINLGMFFVPGSYKWLNLSAALVIAVGLAYIYKVDRDIRRLKGE